MNLLCAVNAFFFVLFCFFPELWQLLRVTNRDGGVAVQNQYGVIYRVGSYLMVVIV